jgi:putative transport protein
MELIRETLLRSEPLLLFLVIGLGYLAGQIRVRGFSLGIAGVLFVGLFFGGWRPEGAPPFAIAHQVTQLGLILFVYAVGLTTGPGFFQSFRARGLPFNLAVLIALIAGAGVTLGIGILLRVPAGELAGVYCGGLTNTPALAAVTELIGARDLGSRNAAAVGYSMAYPYGVIGGLLAFQMFVWYFREVFEKEKAEAQTRGTGAQRLVSGNFEVRNPALIGHAIGELQVQNQSGLIISRHKHGDRVQIPTKYAILHEGDVVLAVGTAENIARAEAYFGGKANEHLEVQSSISMRRILVSRKQFAGKTIEELELDRRFNAQVTRLRRADFDMIPTLDMPLEIGDRLRVVMPAEKAAEVSQYFGDSERSIAELDYTAMTLGISIGVLLGLVPIPIPGGASVSLGFAGGPLIAGLLLGRLGRTGPLVWSIPLEANQALRHIGLLIFLAGVGIMAGGQFFDALSGNGLRLVALGFVTTTLTTLLTLVLLRTIGKSSVIGAIGATSGMQTQPATLAKAYEMSQSDETYVAYATTYPVAMVGKILIAQIVLLLADWLLGIT